MAILSHTSLVILATLLCSTPSLSARLNGGGRSSYFAPPQNSPPSGGGGANGYPSPGGNGGGGGYGAPSFGSGGPQSDAGFGNNFGGAGTGAGDESYGQTPPIPETSFDCSEYEFPGYYADLEANCQIFHICQADGRHDAFLCPNGTLFQQQYLVCDWDYNVNCEASEQFFNVNAEIGKVPEGSGGNGNGQTGPANDFGNGFGGGNNGYGVGNGFGNGNGRPFGDSVAPPPAPGLTYGAPGK